MTATLNGILGGTTIAAVTGLLQNVGDLYDAVSPLAPGYKTFFSAIYGIDLTNGISTVAEYTAMTGIVTAGTYTTSAAYVTLLQKNSDLVDAVTAGGAATKASFLAVTGINVDAALTPANFATLSGITGDPAYVDAATYITGLNAAQTLYNTVNAMGATQKQIFKDVFGVDVSLALDAGMTATLNGILGGTTIAAVTGLLQNVGDLYDAVSPLAPGYKTFFSAIYGISITNGISTVAEYTAMTGIVTAGTYTTSAAYVTLLQKNSDLVDAVTAGGAATKASFLAVTGINVDAALTPANFATLSGITGDPAYVDAATYITGLNAAQTLYNTVNAMGATQKQIFKDVFGVDVSLALDAGMTATLNGILGGTTIAAVTGLLQNVGDLYDAVSPLAPGYKTFFSAIYGIDLTNGISTVAEYTAMTGIVTAGTYTTSAAYVTLLQKNSDLVDAVTAGGAATKASFLAVTGINVDAALTPANFATLSGITGDPAYVDAATYITGLNAAQTLYNTVNAMGATQKQIFKDVFGVDVSLALDAGMTATLNGILGGTTIAAVTGLLQNVGDLYDAVSPLAPGYKTFFSAIYGIDLTNGISTVAEYTAMTGIVTAGTYTTSAAYVTLLQKNSDLVDAVTAGGAATKASFLAVTGINVDAALTPANFATLSGITGDPAYVDAATYITGLNAAQTLYNTVNAMGATQKQIFKDVFGVDVSLALDAGMTATLNGILGGTTIAAVTGLLQNVGDLYDAVSPLAPGYKTFFSAIYGIDLTNGISTVAEYTAMTGIVTAGTYTTSAAYVTLLQKNSDLVDAVTAGGAATKASFLAVTGINVDAALTPANFATLSGITGDPAYVDAATYITGLNAAQTLYNTVNAMGATQKQIFKDVFGVDVSLALDAGMTATLNGILGGTTIAAVTGLLQNVGDLYDAVSPLAPGYKTFFSAIYGIDLTNGISTVAEYTAMTGIVTAGTYTTSAAYVTLLQKNSDLVDAVTAGGAATKASFLAVTGINVDAALTPANFATLSGITGDPAYVDAATYITGLNAAQTLYNTVNAMGATQKQIFKDVFGVDVSLALDAGMTATLNGILGGTTIAAVTGLLQNVGDLYDAVSPLAPGYKTF